MIKNTKHFIFAILTFILCICVNILFVVNSTFIFKFFSISNKTSEILALPLDSILSDYNKIISFIRNPLIYNLRFENFSLSNNGLIHFFEVKTIFMYIFMIAFSILVFFAAYLIYKNFFFQKTLLHDRLKRNLKIFNHYFNVIVICTTLFIGIFIFIDFESLFIKFHEILFNNDLWIFNSTTDSIINILPQNFFMLCSIIIFLMLLLETFILNFSLKKDVD
ncbi:MAG: TIGR01906 family membrane protein [Sarcina sp.]